MTQYTYIIYLRTGHDARKCVYYRAVPDDATEAHAIEQVRRRFHSDGATREPLQLFVGTSDEARERVDALAALNDATAQTGTV